MPSRTSTGGCRKPWRRWISRPPCYVKFEDALKDRSRSIITVDTLSGIGEGKGDLLPVMTAEGKSASLLRSELAAITAELRIVMEDKPFDFFDHTDLLDFPDIDRAAAWPRRTCRDTSPSRECGSS